MSDDGESVNTFEAMPRPASEREFADWIVPARNNIQREMLRLRPIIAYPPIVTIPLWVLRSRRLVLGACFSLWRSVFQARYFYKKGELSTDMHKDSAAFLGEIIHNNAATYNTELNSWSLEYYVENAVYRLRHARTLAIEAGVDAAGLPEAHMFGESEADQREFFLRSTPFTPYGEWEECFHTTRALITTMREAIDRGRRPTSPRSASASDASQSPEPPPEPDDPDRTSSHSPQTSSDRSDQPT